MDPLANSLAPGAIKLPGSKPKEISITKNEKKTHDVGAQALESLPLVGQSIPQASKGTASPTAIAKKVSSAAHINQSASSSASSSQVAASSSVKVKDFAGEVHESEAGVKMVKELMSNQDNRTSFDRDISRTDSFSINGKRYDPQNTTEILEILKEGLGEKFNAIAGIFQQALYKDILKKLMDLQEESDLPVSSNNEDQEHWEITIGENEITVKVKRSFNFRDNPVQPYGIIAVEREIKLNKEEITDVQVKDSYTSLHPIEADVAAAIDEAIKELESMKVSIKPLVEENKEKSFKTISSTKTQKYASTNVRVSIDAAIKRVKERLQLIEYEISYRLDEPGQLLTKEMLEGKREKVFSLLKTLEGFDHTTPLFKKIEKYEQKVVGISYEIVANQAKQDELEAKKQEIQSSIQAQLANLQLSAENDAKAMQNQMSAIKERIDPLYKQIEELDTKIQIHIDYEAKKIAELQALRLENQSNLEAQAKIIQTLNESLDYVPIQEFRGEQRISFAGRQAFMHLATGLKENGTAFSMDTITDERGSFSIPHQFHRDLLGVSAFQIEDIPYPPLSGDAKVDDKQVREMYETLKTLIGEVKINQVLHAMQQGLTDDIGRAIHEIANFQSGYMIPAPKGADQSWEIKREGNVLRITLKMPFYLNRDRNQEMERFGVIGVRREVIIQLDNPNELIQSIDVKVKDTFSAFYSADDSTVQLQGEEALKRLKS